MPQRLAQPGPIQGPGLSAKADIIMKGIPSMVEAYTTMAKIAAANAQNSADNQTRANIAYAGMQNEMAQRAMALQAQASQAEAEMAFKADMANAEFNNRMQLRQMELSLPEQMDMMRQKNALASIDKEMGPGGSLSQEDGKRLRGMVEGGLTYYQSRSVLHGMKQDEMRMRREDALIQRQQNIEDQVQKYNAQNFFDRSAKAPNPEQYYKVKSQLDAMPGSAMLPPAAKEKMIMSELEKIPGGMMWFIQERRPDGSMSYKPFAEASGQASQMALEDLMHNRKASQMQHLEGAWASADEAARKHAMGIIEASVKAGKKEDGSNTSPYADIESPLTRAKLEEYRQEFMRQRGMLPDWPSHLAMVEAKQSGKPYAEPRPQQYQPKEGEAPLGKPFDLRKDIAEQGLDTAQMRVMSSLNRDAGMLDKVPASPKEKEFGKIWINTMRELLATYGDARSMPANAQAQFYQAAQNLQNLMTSMNGREPQREGWQLTPLGPAGIPLPRR